MVLPLRLARSAIPTSPLVEMTKDTPISVSKAAAAPSSSLKRSSRRNTPSLRKLHFKGKEEANKKLQISFGGCGFLGVYHVGVGKCVVDHAPHLFSEFDSFYGASAGAITAACAACRSDPMIPYKWVRKTFEDSQKYWFGMINPSFDLYGRLREFLNGFLPENAHKLCRDVVKISLTVMGSNGMPENWLVSDFRTRQELINIIIASSFIPGYAGFKDLPKIRGRRCCDGGFTSNIPCVSDPDVITVSPFSGFCDICPQGESCTQHMINICDQPMQISPSNLYRLAKSLCPTSWKELEDLYHQGYSDCLAFFRREGLIPDPKIQRRRSPLSTTPTSDRPSSLPLATRACDLPGNHSNSSLSRVTSLTLSASGEFLSHVGEGRSLFASIPLEDIERGLDLKGTEKATVEMRQCGREVSHHDLTRNYSEEAMRVMARDAEMASEPSTGVIAKIVKPPIKIMRVSYNSLSWMMQSCYVHELIPERLSSQWPLSKVLPANKPVFSCSHFEDDDPSSHEGFLGMAPNSLVAF